jgi:hypothetical protein
MRTLQTKSGLTRSLAVLLLGLAAGSADAQGRFTLSADGAEVTDTTTKLVWRRCVEGMQWDGKACSGKPMRFKYAEAKRHVADSGKGWGIPTRTELASLVDRTPKKKKPLIDAVAFPQTPALQFWAKRPGTDDNLNAWLVSFANGKVYGNMGEARFPLRLVRPAP